jgi:hypothetical protein
MKGLISNYFEGFLLFLILTKQEATQKIVQHLGASALAIG